MTICGYNTQIGSGLNLLIEGMASAMEEKADMLDDPIQALDNEINELDIMINTMQNQGVIQDMFIGLNILAKALFIEVKKEILNNPNQSQSIREACLRIGPSFVATIKNAEEYRKSIEEHYEDSKENPLIKTVAEWVNKNGNYPKLSILAQV